MTFEFVKPKIEKKKAEEVEKELETKNIDKKEEKISAKEKMSRTTGRSFEFYKQFFNLEPDDLDGKKVLNIGAGRSDIQKELEDQNIKPELLVNLDLAYRDVGDSKGVFKKVSGKDLNREDVPDNAVAGDMKNLPFSDKSMDKIMCLWSVGWLKEEDKPQAMEEIYRTCSDHGEINIYPISYPKKEKEVLEKYPFLEVMKPKLDKKEISKVGSEKEGLWKKTKRFLSNFDYVQIENINKILDALQGKEVASFTIKKEVPEDEFRKIVKELVDKGFIF